MNLEVTLLFGDFSKSFDSMHRGKIAHILLVWDLTKETVIGIMMRYKTKKAMVHSPE